MKRFCFKTAPLSIDSRRSHVSARAALGHNVAHKVGHTMEWLEE